MFDALSFKRSVGAWHRAPGRIAQTLIEREYANPGVVLDEARGGRRARYDPMGARKVPGLGESTLQMSRGQLLCSSRDNARSASTLPPVWQTGQ